MTGGEADQVSPLSGSSRRSRWWLDIRWIAAGVGAGAIAFLLWGLFGPEPAIRVSRETTFLTEPLAADGLPDYHAAILALAGPAPPPEENAAAALLQVCWPMGIDDADLPSFCAALRIPNEPPPVLLRAPYDDAGSKVSREACEAAEAGPWTSEELPELAAWLRANTLTIDQIVMASARERFWLPHHSLVATSGSLFDSWILSEMGVGGAIRLLEYRAMWHLGEGRHGAAWDDMFAAYRLGRLMIAPDRGSQYLVTRLVALASQSTAASVMAKHILSAPGLPAEVLVKIKRDLDAIGRPHFPHDPVTAERLFEIDVLVFASSRVSGGRRERAEYLEEFMPPEVAPLLRTSLDWNQILKRTNSRLDAFAAAIQLPTHAERKQAFEKLSKARDTEARQWNSGFHVPMALCSRGYRSAAVAASGAETIDTSAAWCDVPSRSLALYELVRTATALAAWHADHAADGAGYPGRLEVLVPTHLAAVPNDPFSEEPLIYERRGEGYILASVGPNGIYDGGTDMNGWIVKGEWQSDEQDVPYDKSDLVVRMPVPARPFVKPSTP